MTAHVLFLSFVREMQKYYKTYYTIEDTGRQEGLSFLSHHFAERMIILKLHKSGKTRH